MSWPGIIFCCGCFFILALVTEAEVLVQLNINRPINDVSDKFISFIMKPEDLYRALDSSNRKTVTRMASMLSHSHVKFVGDYYFAAKTEGIRLRNPTKIVWKGFNKWTKAVNWSMIIPVPYKPDNWDPMDTLQILNTSQMVDIDEAIWQLGTDFGASRAADYVTELKTFNLMVDSFRHVMMNWQTIGADISPGSSPEETRRYVEMSRDMNAAYGWIQSDELFSGNSVVSSLEEQDPALQVLFRSKVPVWLTLPKKKELPLRMEDEVVDGLQWAQTMGEAANIGFDTIFKSVTLDDMENLTYSFYVTVLFKKIMGSRVYPAQPLTNYIRGNKLYTHCAGMVSGGLSLMIVNKQMQPLYITVRPSSKLQDAEVWQYSLTMHNGNVMLNNNKLNINSTLLPEVRRKNTKYMLQLRAEGMSVSFWVLPNANLEHCHFREVQTPVMPNIFTKKNKRYSSSDRLLKELIKETAKKPTFSPLAGMLNRHRRSVDIEDRFKRFILEGSRDKPKAFTSLADNLAQEIKNPLKRDIFTPDRRMPALDWLSNLFREPPLNLGLPLLKRNARQSDSLKGPFFITRDGKKTTFTKKITEIKKPEKKFKKLISEDQEFDEEKFFKNVGMQTEPEYLRIPEGDVYLSRIASVDGTDAEDEFTIETKKSQKESSCQPQEIVSVVKPLRLLPTEFFEALPAKPAPPMPINPNFDSLYNSVSYSVPSVKQLKEVDLAVEMDKEMEAEADTNDEDDTSKTEINITQKAPGNGAAVEGADKDNEHLLVADADNSLAPKTYLSEDNVNFYADVSNSERAKLIASNGKSAQSNIEKYVEIPWWDLSATRFKRSLDTTDNRDFRQENIIAKGEDPMTAANELIPTRLRQFENKVDEVVRTTRGNRVDKEAADVGVGQEIVKVVKDQVTKFLDLITYHANEWYNTLAKQFDANATTEGHRVA